MSATRIECYLHSDKSTYHKGGALVELHCETDFASKTDEFASFALKVAKFVYGSQKTKWNEIIEIFPELETERNALSLLLKEEISLGEVAILPKSKVDRGKTVTC